MLTSEQENKIKELSAQSESFKKTFQRCAIDVLTNIQTLNEEPQPTDATAERQIELWQYFLESMFLALENFQEHRKFIKQIYDIHALAKEGCNQ